MTTDQRIGIDGLWRDVRCPPGALNGRPALFLDRDGVIVEEVNYLHRREDVLLVDGIADLINRAKASGVAVIVVTNQAGIGRGLYGWADLAAVQEEISARLGPQGAAFDAVFACPFHAEAQPPYRHHDHPARKPNPGMLFMAAELLGIDLGSSWIVGDRATDMMAARHAGLAGGLLLGSGYAADEAATALALERDDFHARQLTSLVEADRHISWLA